MVLNQDVSLTGKRPAIAAGFMDGYVPYRDQKKRKESLAEQNRSFPSNQSSSIDDKMSNLTEKDKKSIDTMFR